MRGEQYGWKGAARLLVGSRIADGIVVEGDRLVERRRGRSSELASLAGIASLRGHHNAQNAASAVATLGNLAQDRARLQQALRTFPGLPHRMEEVGRRGRVLFINDSKATDADAAEKALSSFEPIYWIAGGKAKEGGIEPLRPLFPRIAGAYLIGAAANDFARTLQGSVAYDMCGTLDVARRSCRSRRRRIEGGGAGRVLIACLCLVRSVCRLREARRPLSGTCARLCDAPNFSSRRRTMISRAVRSPFAEWWWTIDRWLLAALGMLMVIGIVLAMAGSPPVAERLASLDVPLCQPPGALSGPRRRGAYRDIFLDAAARAPRALLSLYSGHDACRS